MGQQTSKSELKTTASASPSRALIERLWADQAANGLRRQAPELSAATGFRQAERWRLLAGSALLVGACLLCPGPTLATLIAVSAVGFASLIGLRLLACLLREGIAPWHRIEDAALPRAAILIPAYREAAILPHLVTGLAQIDYPPDRLDIRLVLEADDRETLDLARQLRSQGYAFDIISVPPGEPRTKPRALNYGLRHIEAEIITILDAEDRPDAVQLRRAAETFTAAPTSLACLQAPLNWYNRDTSWITRQFALEYATHFKVMLPLYLRLGWPIPLGGTSNFFRSSALRAVGGWDAHNVTEDADLGFRLARAGYQCGVIEPVTLEEAPIRAAPWVRQRSRWLKGYAQTLIVHSRRQTGPDRGRQRLALYMTLGAALVSALGHAPLALGSLIWIGLNWSASAAQTLSLAFLLSGYWAAALCAWRGLVRAKMRIYASDFLLMPFYWPLQTLAAARALWQLGVNPYFWEKTEHGQLRDPTCTYPSPPR